MRPMMTWLVAAGLFVAFVLGYFYIRQESMVYFPWRKMDADPQALGWSVQAVRLDTEDRQQIAGWFIPAPCPRPPCVSRGTVLFSHGNAGNISHRLGTIALFREIDLDVFIYDYRGYGDSEGRPSEAATYQDASAAWRHLVAGRGIAPGRILLYGESLGSALSIWLATRERPAGVVLVSPFTSVPDLGTHHYPWLPVRMLARIHYDNRARLSQVQAPLLIFHSRDDEIVPYTHAEQLFAVANEPKRLVTLLGDHNSGLFRSAERVRDELRRFVKEVLPRPLPPKPPKRGRPQPKR